MLNTSSASAVRTQRRAFCWCLGIIKAQTRMLSWFLLLREFVKGHGLTLHGMVFLVLFFSFSKIALLSSRIVILD